MRAKILATGVHGAQAAAVEHEVHVLEDEGLPAPESGVHTFDRAQPLALYFDPAHLFAFSPDGSLAAAPCSHGDD